MKIAEGATEVDHFRIEILEKSNIEKTFELKIEKKKNDYPYPILPLTYDP